MVAVASWRENVRARAVRTAVGDLPVANRQRKECDRQPGQQDDKREHNDQRDSAAAVRWTAHREENVMGKHGSSRSIGCQGRNAAGRSGPARRRPAESGRRRRACFGQSRPARFLAGSAGGEELRSFALMSRNAVAMWLRSGAMRRLDASSTANATTTAWTSCKPLTALCAGVPQ